MRPVYSHALLDGVSFASAFGQLELVFRNRFRKTRLQLRKFNVLKEHPGAAAQRDGKRAKLFDKLEW